MPIDVDASGGSDESQAKGKKESFQKAESNGGYDDISTEAKRRAFPFSAVVVLLLVLSLAERLRAAPARTRRKHIAAAR
jgi:hypothetical protein